MSLIIGPHHRRIGMSAILKKTNKRDLLRLEKLLRQIEKYDRKMTLSQREAKKERKI